MIKKKGKKLSMALVSKESRQEVGTFLEQFPLNKDDIEQAKFANTSNGYPKVIRSTAAYERHVPPPVVLSEKLEEEETSLPAFKCKKQINESLSEKPNHADYWWHRMWKKQLRFLNIFSKKASKLKKPCESYRNERLGGIVAIIFDWTNRPAKIPFNVLHHRDIVRMLGVPNLVNSILTLFWMKFMKEESTQTELKVVLIFHRRRITIESSLYSVKDFYLPVYSLLFLVRRMSKLERRSRHFYDRPLFSYTSAAAQAQVCPIKSFDRDELLKAYTNSLDRRGILVFLPGINEILSVKRRIEELTTDVFHKLDGVRKIILSTNIAEASITIDDIVFRD
uniref:Uncharacterized protein n=1 Tax=Ditylenchus dipsaci TaxID=166011 RepID=A0A915CTI8_9BILA